MSTFLCDCNVVFRFISSSRETVHTISAPVPFNVSQTPSLRLRSASELLFSRKIPIFLPDRFPLFFSSNFCTKATPISYWSGSVTGISDCFLVSARLSPANIIGTFFCIFFNCEYSLLFPVILTIIASAPLSISCFTTSISSSDKLILDLLISMVFTPYSWDAIFKPYLNADHWLSSISGIMTAIRSVLSSFLLYSIKNAKMTTSIPKIISVKIKLLFPFFIFFLSAL